MVCAGSMGNPSQLQGASRNIAYIVDKSPDVILLVQTQQNNGQEGYNNEGRKEPINTAS
jgi:hypothetical protein